MKRGLFRLRFVMFVTNSNNDYMMHSTVRGISVHESSHLPDAVQPFPKRLHGGSGFTLIELIVVIALLALMASVAILSQDTVRSDAEADATRYEMSVIRKALLQFRYDVRHFPDGVGALIAAEDRLALLTACQATDNTKINETSGVSYDEGCTDWDPELKRGWNGPYLSAGGGEDAWGTAYRLLDPDDDTPGSGTARIVSYGENGVYEGVNATDACQKFNDDSDDIVLCLVQ